MNKRRLFKIGKWFLGILLSIVLLISGGLYIFKDDIIKLVLEEVNQHLKAKVSVSKVDLTFWGTFPNLSVDFNHVFIQDSYENSTELDTLLYSDLIQLKFNPIDVWRENYTVKKIAIAPGTLQLKVNDQGEVNYDILQPTNDSTESESFDFKLEEVSLEEVRFVYANASINHRYETDIHEMELEGAFSEKVFTLNASTELDVKQAKSGQVNLISNQPAQFDIAIEINQNTGTFKIPKATIFVAKLPFALNGKVTPDSIDFNLNAKNLSLADVANNFSMSQMEHVHQFQGSGKVNFDLAIKGKKSSTEPVSIACDFGIKNGQLTEPVKKQKIKDIQLKGKYSNKGGASKEYLALENVFFTTSAGPFSGEVTLTHFAAPILNGKANGELNLSIIHSLFNIPAIQEIKGNLGLNTVFKVQGQPQANETMRYEIFKCEGQAEFKNVAFQLVDDKRLFDQINGKVFLLNDDAGLQDISLKLGNSDLTLNGAFSNVISYFKHEAELKADVTVLSRRIDIEDLGTTAKEVQLQEARTFMFPENIAGNVDLTVGRLGYEGHQFELINGTMNIKNRVLSFPNLSFRNSDATISGNLIIEERSPEVFNVKTILSSSNIKLKSVFKEWNNFKQDVIREEHIYGNAAISLYLDAPFDLRSGVFFKAVKADIQLKITDGRLKNVEAFDAIVESLKTPAARLAIGKQNILSLEKKLKDLTFETLENHLIIRNGIIEIPEMNIASNILDIETSGTHTFDNKIDYKFAFRFRDLKAEKETEFGTVIDDGTGVRIYMRMHGTLDNPIVEWDKAASKEDRKEYNEQEKANLKSMLKTDFGMFSNDTTVKKYQEVIRPKEKLEVQYGKDTTSVDDFVKEKKEKNGKFNKWLKTMENESKEQKKVTVEFE